MGNQCQHHNNRHPGQFRSAVIQQGENSGGNDGGEQEGGGPKAEQRSRAAMPPQISAAR